MLSSVESTVFGSRSADSSSFKPATSKATMCLEINKIHKLRPYPQENAEHSLSRIRGAGGHRAKLGVCQISRVESTGCSYSGGYPAPILRRAGGLPAEPRCVLKSTDAKITVPSPRRCGLNSHKHPQHGGRTERLPEKLLRAGDREGEALYSFSLENVYRWLRAEITATLGRAGGARNGGPIK
jgi:hypothetical protein